ncbi:MAG: ThiF family adenylyltransferase [Planctomycetia bacterium]|nr:ThiF family adenylyltransferase [Planctomycetia bacterium]
MSVHRDIHLVVAESDFESVLRKQLFAGHLWALGDIQWRTILHEDRGIARALTTAESLPRGINRPPLDDFLVMRVTGSSELNPKRIIDDIQPRRSQTVVVLLLDSDDHEKWAGAVFRNGTVHPLAGFSIVGGEMLTVAASRDEDTGDFTVDDDSRYSRLRGAVGDDVYRKLRNSAVTIIGTSRSGTLAAWQFAALGVRTLRLCDFDIVADHNLDNMIGVDWKTIGTAKVFALAEALLRYRPDMNVTCFEQSILDTQAKAVFDQPTDLFVTCTDNLTSRVAVSLEARRLLVPHLDLGTSVQSDDAGNRQIAGDARLFVGQGCCFCTPPLVTADRERVLYELSAPAGSLRRGEPARWDAERAGSLITINSLSVAAGVQMWLDLLAGNLRTSFWQRIAWLPGERLQTNASSIGSAGDCPICRT